MKRLIYSILMITILIGCDQTTDPNPDSTTGTGSTKTDAILAELPDGLPKTTDCIIGDLQFDISGTVSDKLVYTLTYDKYNRITKSITNSTQYPNTTTYTYEKGKIKIVQDALFFGGLKTNTNIEYTLDGKNRVSTSESTIKGNQSSNDFTSTTKVSYKYDSNGYLEETKSETDKNIAQTTKYFWEDGNLTKTEVTNYNDPKSKYDKWTNITNYEFDKTKTNGSWDVNSVSGAAVAPGIAYFGKINKNVITKLKTINDWVISTPISINAKLTVTSDYKYTYDTKGYPATFDINTNTLVEGTYPIGVPATNAKGAVKYKCN